MNYFQMNKRLGIAIPCFKREWDALEKQTQQDILLQWEKIRGSIPDHIQKIETEINEKQAQLSNEADFAISCELNSQIAELASIINDLWLWYRTDQDVSGKSHL